MNQITPNRRYVTLPCDWCLKRFEMQKSQKRGRVICTDAVWIT